MTDPDFARQQDYYARTAERYDDWHHAGASPHDLAMVLLSGWLAGPGRDCCSILDIGSGTGRVVSAMMQRFPDRKIVGVEPSDALRLVGHKTHGIPPENLVEGNALSLDWPDGAFDVVTEFGALHHIKDHERAVSEMLRVARRAIFISDNNNFGHGSGLARMLKRLIHAAGLWGVATWVQTGGKGYYISEGDGLFYSYSVFDDLPQIRAACEAVHILNTSGEGTHAFAAAPHVALLGLKREAGDG